MEDGENNGVGDSNHKDIISTPAAAPSLAEEVLISSLVQGKNTVPDLYPLFPFVAHDPFGFWVICRRQF